MHKRLDLNQTEFNDSLVKITRLTDMIKLPPNEIRTKLKTYEKLEHEMDEVILQAAECNYFRLIIYIP